MTRVSGWFLAALAGVVWAASPAGANYAIDLIWADSGSSHLDIAGPGDPTATAGGTLCHSGALSSAGSGRCLLIQLTATAQFGSALVSLGLPPIPLMLTVVRPGIDGVTDKKHNFAPVQLNNATLFVAPEPGSAGLLALGFLALACFGRTRKA
jgi:hypothetical protein